MGWYHHGYSMVFPIFMGWIANVYITRLIASHSQKPVGSQIARPGLRCCEAESFFGSSWTTSETEPGIPTMGYIYIYADNYWYIYSMLYWYVYITTDLTILFHSQKIGRRKVHFRFRRSEAHVNCRIPVADTYSWEPRTYHFMFKWQFLWRNTTVPNLWEDPVL